MVRVGVSLGVFGAAVSLPGSVVALSLAPSVSAPGVADALGRSALVLDVRDAFEWDEGHLEGATHTPLRSLTPEFCREVARSAGRSRVVVVDLDGRRAARAQAVLASHGVRDARILDGGMLGWARAQEGSARGGGVPALRLVGQGGAPGHLAKFDYTSFKKGCGWATRMVGGCGSTNQHLARTEPLMAPLLLPKGERARLGYEAVFNDGLDIPGT